MGHDKWLGAAKEKEIGFLFSYYHFMRSDLSGMLNKMPYRSKVFVDSGGYTASYKGVDISAEEYARFIRRNKDVIDIYANIDEIGNPKVTLKNQLRLESMGLRPLPVIHFGTNPEEIARYHRHGYDYMCLGGLVPQVPIMVPAIRRGEMCDSLKWMHECHGIAKELGVKLHGFGCTTWDLVSAFPWTSIDSASWAAGYMWGALMFWDLKHKTWRLVRARDPKIMKYAYTIRPYGIRPVSLIRDGSEQRADMLHLSAWSWLAAQRFENEGRLGTESPQVTVYLVDAAKAHIEYAANVIKKNCREDLKNV